MLNIVIGGIGGQGSVLAARILAQAALDKGWKVRTAETIGMAQRGGVVESVCLLGGWRAPKLDFGEADLMLGFEPLETLRGLPYLRSDGVVFSSSDPMPPVGVNLGVETYPSIDEIKAKVGAASRASHFLPCRELGEKAGAVQAGNTVLLAAVCASGILPFGLSVFEEALRKFLPAKILDVNLRALEIGESILAGK